MLSISVCSHAKIVANVLSHILVGMGNVVCLLAVNVEMMKNVVIKAPVNIINV